MDRVRIPLAGLKAIADAAEEAYPAECCGLLVGARERRGFHIRRVVPSRNVAPPGVRDRFEIDPSLRLRLQRTLRESDDAVIGLYHSHPDATARPSAVDRACAWEPELVWLITAVVAGQAVATTAHLAVECEGALVFRELPLVALRRRRTPTATRSREGTP